MSTVLEEIQMHRNLLTSRNAEFHAEHLAHLLQGHRETVRGETECPYAPDSPRAVSWNQGATMAYADLKHRGIV